MRVFQFQNKLIHAFEGFGDDLILFKIAVWLLLGQGGRPDDFTKSKWSEEGFRYYSSVIRERLIIPFYYSHSLKINCNG